MNRAPLRRLIEKRELFKLDIEDFKPNRCRRRMDEASLPTSQPSHHAKSMWQPASVKNNKHESSLQPRHDRITTEISKDGKSCKNRSSKKRALTLSKEKKDLKQAIQSLPVPSLRTYDSLLALCEQLTSRIPFFRKLTENLTMQMLRRGEVRSLRRGQFLYKRTSELAGVAVVLIGRLQVSHILQRYEYFARPGDLLGEALFCDEEFFKQETITSFQFCRASTGCSVLVLSLRLLRGLREQIGKGLTKQDLSLLSSYIKREYLEKRALKSSVC